MPSTLTLISPIVSMKHSLLVAILSLIVVSPLISQSNDTLRVCYYNLTSVSEGTDTVQFVAIRSVLEAIGPRLLVVENINDATELAHFNEFVASHLPDLGGVIASTGNTTNAAVYFDSTLLTLRPELTHNVTTGGRPMLATSFLVRSTGDTLDCFAAVLPSEPDSIGAALRSEQASTIRRSLDSSTGHVRIGAGSFNLTGADEEAYFWLTFVGIVASGELYDPTERTGLWHYNPDAAAIHTSLSRIIITQDSIRGGLASRSDYVLLATTRNVSVLPGTYTTFGNDGLHYRASVDNPPNNAVPPAIAEALRLASDHLPVYVDLVLHKAASGVDHHNADPSGSLDLSENKP